VLPEESWDAFNPQVIRWKLASPARLTQLRELTELRNAVEPLAALLAAERASDAEREEIVRLAASMWAAGKTGRQQAFLDLDVTFHHLVLTASGNRMIGKLHLLTQEVLEGRVQYGLMPQLPDHAALEWHMDVAAAIQRGDGPAARAGMEKIVEQSLVEMAHMWEAT
jgi:DNA-binding FadR family transcriptional regulator